MQYTEDAINKRKQKAQVLKKHITIIAYTLIIPMLIYNVSLMIQAITNPYRTPSFFGIKTYAIISGSMEPNIKVGDIVLVKEVNEEELKEGDIISFRHGQSVITHRIIKIENKETGLEYITKGDNNNVEDNEKINFSLIEGKVIGRIMYLGKASKLLQGKTSIIVIALIIYIYFSHTSNVINRKNRRKVKRLKYEEESNGEEKNNNEN